MQNRLKKKTLSLEFLKSNLMRIKKSINGVLLPIQSPFFIYLDKSKTTTTKNSKNSPLLSISPAKMETFAFHISTFQSSIIYIFLLE